MENKTFFENNKSNVWFWAFIVLVGSLFFLIPRMSLDAGNSGDEDTFQIIQGNYILDYFRSGGEDTNCLTFKNLKYYGSSFDLITAFYNDTFGIDDIHVTRHIFNSFFGWIAILFVGLIAVFIGGWRAGVFSVLLLFLSPRFLGHSFNNPKDIPFAAAVISAIFFMFLFFKQFPKVKWYTIVLLILSIAFSISIRIGGLILFGYFGLFGLVYLISTLRENKLALKESNSKLKNKKVSIWTGAVSSKNIFRLLIYGVGICVVGYFLGLLLWPYALQDPIRNPMEAFAAMSKFEIAIRQNFEGALQWSDSLPWYYTPKFILITIPLAVIIGALIYPFTGGWKKENRMATFMIYFLFIFPVFWIVYTNANVYGGWRHSIFAYPPMVVAAGLGFDALIKWVNKKVIKIVLTFLPFLLLIMPFIHIVKNHPYEYIYFNEFAGGMNNVYGNYEMDYYYNTTRGATEWVIENAEKSGLEMGNKIKVATWHYQSVKYFLRDDTVKFQPLFVRWYERGNSDWDYAVFPITGIAPEQIKSEFFPPKNTVHTIQLDGKPIAIVLKRTDKSDYLGDKFKKEQQWDSAFYYLNRAVKLDPANESALINLIELHMMKNQTDSAKLYMDQFLKIDPYNESVNYFLAYYFLQKGESDQALNTCKKILKYNFKFGGGYILASQIYIQKNEIRKAEKMLLEMMERNVINNEGVSLLIRIYQAQGMDERTAYKKLYKKFAEKYEKDGDKENYELYYNLYRKM